MSRSPAEAAYPALRSLRSIDTQEQLSGITHAFPPGVRMHTTLAAVDISDFGRRDDEAQLLLRKSMYGCLAQAFATVRLPWWNCHREDRGDGILIVTPPGVASESLMDPLAHDLRGRLRHHNRLTSDAARLHLRLAVHAGQVRWDEHGVVGHPLVHLFRLLEAQAFKKATAGNDLGLIVSDQLYNDATKRGGLIDPDAYRPRQIACKGTRAKAWIWDPHTSR